MIFSGMEKSRQELVDLVKVKMEEKTANTKMFGYSILFNDNMFVGVHGDKPY